MTPSPYLSWELCEVGNKEKLTDPFLDQKLGSFVFLQNKNVRFKIAGNGFWCIKFEYCACESIDSPKICWYFILEAPLIIMSLQIKLINFVKKRHNYRLLSQQGKLAQPCSVLKAGNGSTMYQAVTSNGGKKHHFLLLKLINILTN